MSKHTYTEKWYQAAHCILDAIEAQKTQVKDLSYCVDEEGQHHEAYDSSCMLVLNDRIVSKPLSDIYPKYTSMTPQSVGAIISNIKRLNDNHRQDTARACWLDTYEDEKEDHVVVETTLPFGRDHFIGIKLTFEGHLS